MTHTIPTDDRDTTASPNQDTPANKRKSKKDKIRSAWIAFVGRIIAQIIGAAASIFFGVLILHKYQSGSDTPGKAHASQPAAAEERPAHARARSRADDLALAVLPLENFSGDVQQDAFADAMTEALTADLSQVSGLRVISRTTAMPYKRRQKTAVEIARELDVDWLLEGSVTRSGDRVRVTAQLIDAVADEHVWARAYDRTGRDALGLQSEIAAAITRDLALHTAGGR